MDLNDILMQRLYKEEDNTSEKRSPYFRDYGRIIHSGAFRRLQGKVQIYPGLRSIIRTRLTHTLEVAEIAESIYYQYFKEIKYVDLESLRAICLIHDLGHPPYGHKGDETLNKILVNKFSENEDITYFEGNAQNFHLVTSEIVYSEKYNGLNLTIRTLLGIFKKGKKVKDFVYVDDYNTITKISKLLGNTIDLLDCKVKTVEAAIMDVADEIAYSTHDLDDAIAKGFITIDELLNYFTSYNDEVMEGKENNVWNIFYNKINEIKDKKIDNNDEREKVRRKIVYSLIGLLISSINTEKIPKGNINVRVYLSSGQELDFSDEIKKFRKEFYKKFIINKFIESRQVKMYEYNSNVFLKEMFHAFYSDIQLLPESYKNLIENDKQNDYFKARVIINYISGMTDSFFAETYSRLFRIEEYNISDSI